MQKYFFSQWMLKRVINHISLSSECIIFNFPQSTSGELTQNLS